MKVHYINLERRKDRNERFLKQNAGIADFERFQAADGRALRVDELIKEGILQEPIKSFTPGSLGAAYSHLQLWDACIADDRVVTIAEDDAVFNHDFVARAEQFLAKLPTDWDIVLWGWNFDSTLCVRIMGGLRQAVLSFDAGQLGSAVADFQKQDLDAQPWRLLGAFGVVCYSLSPQGAARFRRLCFPLKNELIDVPGFPRPLPPLNIDTPMNKYYRDLNAYVSFPPLVWTENERADSDNLPDSQRPSDKQPPPREEAKRQDPSTNGAALPPLSEADQQAERIMEARPAGQDSMKGSSAVLATTETGENFNTFVEPAADAGATAPSLPPDGQPEELHTRGLKLINEGKPDEAIVLLRRAVELKPDSADYQHNLGVAFAHRNRLDEAIASFRTAQKLKPDGTSAFSNMGLALAQQGKFDEAAAAFQECLRLDPKAVDIRHRFANVLRNARKPAEALIQLQEAVHLRPDSAELQHSLGLTLADLEKNEEAIAAYQAALAIEPKYADALNNLGIVLQNIGRSDEAIDCYRKALRIRPHSSETYNNLGVALAARERHDDAIMAYRSALLLFPDSAAAFSNLGNAFRQIGLVDDAVASLDKALNLNPHYAEGYNNKAVALVQAGQPGEGVACYNRALELKPDYPDAYLNRALARLLTGDYDAGLEDYEWRWKRSGRQMPNWGRPLWSGDDPVGRTILLWGEQGLGDTLQYCRYAAVLAQRGAMPLLCVPEPLVRLLQTVPGVVKVASSSDKLPPFSAHAPLMSFPRLIRMTSLDDAPAPIPYVTADRDAAAACREQVRAGAELVVGVVWRGNPQYAGDKIRSVPPELITPLSKIPGVRLVCVMKESDEKERAIAGAADVGAQAWADFADTATVFVNLDLVISVDTSTAHLAGALGIPLWLALPSAPDQRWGLEREDSPWYPTARLFRQSAAHRVEAGIRSYRRGTGPAYAPRLAPRSSCR